MHGNRESAPSIVGTGMACLDVFESSRAGLYRFTAGGSCLNVLLAMRGYGWDTTMLGQIGVDRPGDMVLRDLDRRGVDSWMLLRRPGPFTPIYIQQNLKTGHRFLHSCPACKTTFANFEPIPPQVTEKLLAGLPERIQVCYIDRVSLASVLLARECKARGAVVYFEPNHFDDAKTFKECLQLADVLKYSREKLPNLSAVTDSFGPPVEIETNGAEGLAFRMRFNGKPTEWQALPPVLCTDFVDAAGAGDWLSAGFLNCIGKEGRERMLQTGSLAIESALVAAQAAASRSCQFQGARGEMYQHAPPLFGKQFCPHCS